MLYYKEFQFGWILFVIVLPIQVILTLAYVKQLGEHPLDITGYILTAGILGIVMLLFYGMYTEIKDGVITIRYGIGIIRKNIVINQIKSVQIVSNPAYYGWGIRIIPNGMLYNINGSKAIELGFIDTNRVIRIGTKRPEVLKDIISTLIKK